MCQTDWRHRQMIIVLCKMYSRFGGNVADSKISNNKTHDSKQAICHAFYYMCAFALLDMKVVLCVIC